MTEIQDELRRLRQKEGSMVQAQITTIVQGFLFGVGFWVASWLVGRLLR